MEREGTMMLAVLGEMEKLWRGQGLHGRRISRQRLSGTRTERTIIQMELEHMVIMSISLLLLHFPLVAKSQKLLGFRLCVNIFMCLFG